MTPKLELRALTKTYGNVDVVSQLSLAATDGEMLSLLGPSGCGKTTTLRMIAGFIEPTSGEINLEGEDISRRPVHRRGVGLVFQNYALFPHLTAFDNVAFGLRRRRVPRAEIRKRVEAMLATVELGRHANRYPSQLSGGEQQRVALARVLVLEPGLVLLDEPFSNLDARLRRSMRTELRLLQQRLRFTALFVTHDQEEAMALSDRLAVMHAGELLQIGTPAEVYHAPHSARVAGFIGRANLMRGSITGRDGDAVRVQTQQMELRSSNFDGGADPNDVIAMIRPERMRLVGASAVTTRANAVRVRVRHVEYQGGRCLVTASVGPDTDLLVEVSSAGIEESDFTIGSELLAEWDPDAVWLMPPDDSVTTAKAVQIAEPV